MAELWYFTRNGQPMDPIPADELKRMAAAGDLKPSDLVWKEGMPNWVKASTAKGLFEMAPSTATTEAAPRRHREEETIPLARSERRRPRADDDDLDEAPRRKRRVADDDDWNADDDDRPRRRRRDDDDDDLERRPRRRRKKKSNAGAMIGMIFGGVALVAVLVGVVIAMAVSFGSASMEGTRNWSLDTNEKETYSLRLLAGHRVDLNVKSTGGSDVDLFVYDGDNKFLQDEGLSSDCFLSFTPGTTKTYRIEVVNRQWIDNPVMQARNGHNSGTFTYKQTDLSKVAGGNIPKNPPPPFNNQPFKNQPPIQPPNFPIDNAGPPGRVGAGGFFSSAGQLPVGGRRNHMVHLEANLTYTIEARSDDFDTFLQLQDPLSRVVATDDDGGGDLNSRIVFRTNQAGDYRITVSCFGNEDGGRYMLTVRN